MTNSTHKKTILVVDDTPTNLDILRDGLTPEYAVKAAINGKIALQIAKTQVPDLILLDVMMPEMDGFEVCRQLKEMPETQGIPIIFVTAMGEVKDELMGLKLGAVDYITKPISLPIVQARVHTHLALKEAREELAQKNRQLYEERQMVEEVVVKMRTDHHFDDRHLRTLISPVEATSGDILLSAFRPDGGQHLLLGDFTGHGLPSAIGGPLAAHAFYSRTNEGRSAHEIFSEINQVLYRQLPTRLFMAAVMIKIPPSRDRLTLWNASLPDCLLVRGDGSISHHASSLLALGIIADLDLEEGKEEVLFSANDRLFVFTDGIIEAGDDAQTLFGYPRLQKLLIDCAINNDPLEKVLDAVNHFQARGEQVDDISLIEVSP